MTQTDRLLKELVSEFKIFNSNFKNYCDAETAILILGISDTRKLKYIREHFLGELGDWRDKNKCTKEYCVKSLIELKAKADSGKVDLP